MTTMVNSPFKASQNPFTASTATFPFSKILTPLSVSLKQITMTRAIITISKVFSRKVFTQLIKVRLASSPPTIVERAKGAETTSR